MNITRTLAAALAAVALTAPSALARPADMHAPPAKAGSAQQKSQTPTQDLRSADAQDAARNPRDAREAARPRPGPPTWPAYPQPITPTPVVEAPGSGGGIDWTTIGLGIAGSLLAVSGLAVLASRSRRIQRPRISA